MDYDSMAAENTAAVRAGTAAPWTDEALVEALVAEGADEGDAWAVIDANRNPDPPSLTAPITERDRAVMRVERRSECSDCGHPYAAAHECPVAAAEAAIERINEAALEAGLDDDLERAGALMVDGVTVARVARVELPTTEAEFRSTVLDLLR